MLFKLVLLCSCWFHCSRSAVWSIEELDKCLATYGNTSLVSKCPKGPVFYGSYQERFLYRKCKQMKCDFISSGCVFGKTDPPPSLVCYNILGMMSQKEANCPYKPCEGYNSRSSWCVEDDSVCLQSQGEVQWFGMCKGQDRCCLLKKKS